MNHASLAKANKVARLRRLSHDENSKVSFVVMTPGSSTGTPIQSVVLKEFKVSKTKDGHYIVVGRDLLKESIKEMNSGKAVSLRRNPSDDEKVIRSYRIDRIVNGSMVFA